MRSYSGHEARELLRQGRPASVWAVPDPATRLGYDQTKPGMGGAKVYAPFPDIKITPKFSIPPDAAFFTTGSCFARNIEVALVQSGFRVLSWSPDLDLGHQYFHRYTTQAILHDFKMAVSGFDENLAWQAKPDKWNDYAGFGSAETLDELNQTRLKVHHVFERFRDADVIVATLGLVEAWYDRQLRTYLNFAPHDMLLRDPYRFELRVTDYTENAAYMDELYSILNANMRAGWKMIITVSPVPFNATYSGQDVLVANTYSKATLRAVAEDFAAAHENVAYWPSYEMVMLSDPATAWKEDRRHVRPEHVAKIISAFRRAYIADKEVAAA